MAEIFLSGVLVSFVKLMSYGEIGVGTGFMPYVLFCLLQLLAYQSLDQCSVWNDVAPAPPLPFVLQTGRSGLAQGEWTLQRGDRLLRQPFNLVLPVNDDGYDALVTTLAQGWQQFAQSIAAQIQRSE